MYTIGEKKSMIFTEIVEGKHVNWFKLHVNIL